MEQNTPKQFVLQLGSLASLYLSLGFLLVLLFGLINILLPDAVESVWQREGAHEMVRIGIAMTVVFFPTYLILTRLVNKARRQAPQGAYLTLTKWLIYLSLLVGGGVLLGDLVAVIVTYLNGEVTARFLLKVAAVLLVVGAAFFYYIQDARGFWIENEKCSLRFGSLVSALVLAALVAGFMVVDGPQVVREQKIDEAQLQDLAEIQVRVSNYLLSEGELPPDLKTAYSELSVPTASEGRAAYRYERTSEGFQLCAEFAEDGEEGSFYPYARPVMMPVGEQPMIVNADDWAHNAGEWCFERKVNERAMEEMNQSTNEEFAI